MDDRHYDVTVLDSFPVSTRSFSRWSMGFVGIPLLLKNPKILARAMSELESLEQGR